MLRLDVCCQTKLVADYCNFSKAEARQVWRRSTPKTLQHRAFIGDLSDAEDIGLQALMRSAQSWPLPCDLCRGGREFLNILTGHRETCKRCGGTGKPLNQHKAFHAYLRLAILTQVRNEINHRADEARRQLDYERAARQSSGNFRCGRGVLRATEPEREVSTGLLRVWTGELGSVGTMVESRYFSGTLRLELEAPLDSSKPVAYDVSSLTGLQWLAPSDKLSRAYPRRMLVHTELWEAYCAVYRAEMRHSMVSRQADWRALLHRQAVVLLCSCRAAERCHRTLLAEMLAVGARGVYEGELGSHVK